MNPHRYSCDVFIVFMNKHEGWTVYASFERVLDGYAFETQNRQDIESFFLPPAACRRHCGGFPAA